MPVDQSKVLLVLWLFFSVLLQFSPLGDLDVLTQIRLGELVWNSGHLIGSEHFSFAIQGRDVSNPGWLAQILFFGLYKLGGLWLLRTFYSLLFAGIFAVGAGFALNVTHRSGRDPSLVALVGGVVLAFLVCASNSAVRPQGFAFLGFALMAGLINLNMGMRRKVPIAFIIMLLWQNMHPSLSMLSVLIAANFVAGILAHRGSLRWHFVAEHLILFVLSMLCQFVTPDFMGILDVSRQNALVSRRWLGISEWLPPWNPLVAGAMAMFWVALAFSVAGLVKLRGKIPWASLFPAAVFLGLTCYAARFAVFWAICMQPFWIRMFEAVKPTGIMRWTVGRYSPESRCVRLLWLVVAVASLAAIPVPAGRTMPETEYPLAGIEKLRAELPAGRVFNYREWGGPLVFGNTRWQPFIDGRLYLYDRSVWEEYLNSAVGLMRVQDIVSKFRPQAFFLHPGYQEKMVRALMGMPEWTMIHEDSLAVVFVESGQPINRGDNGIGPQRQGKSR